MKHIFHLTKILTVVFCLSISSGCTIKNEEEKAEETVYDPIDQIFTLDFYYVETCHNCENFKLIAIPRLKNEFSGIQINYYNLDENHDNYDAVIDQLTDFDEEEYESVPFIVIDHSFAIVGYSQGEEEELITEIYRYFNHEELGQYYKIGEYMINQSQTN